MDIDLFMGGLIILTIAAIVIAILTASRTVDSGTQDNRYDDLRKKQRGRSSKN